MNLFDHKIEQVMIRTLKLYLTMIQLRKKPKTMLKHYANVELKVQELDVYHMRGLCFKRLDPSPAREADVKMMFLLFLLVHTPNSVNKHF